MAFFRLTSLMPLGIAYYMRMPRREQNSGHARPVATDGSARFLRVTAKLLSLFDSPYLQGAISCPLYVPCLPRTTVGQLLVRNRRCEGSDDRHDQKEAHRGRNNHRAHLGLEWDSERDCAGRDARVAMEAKGSHGAESIGSRQAGKPNQQINRRGNHANPRWPRGYYRPGLLDSIPPLHLAIMAGVGSLLLSIAAVML